MSAHSAQSSAELAARAAKVIAAWETRLRDEIRPKNRRADSEAAGNDSGVSVRQQLSAHTDALETEIAAIERELADIRARDAFFQVRAMRAIAAGNDIAAKEALSEQMASLDTTEALQADLTVLRAMADECRRALSEFADGSVGGDGRRQDVE